MQIETKYDIGDEVYGIFLDREFASVPVECDTCDSTGKVELKENKFTCPDCQGKSTQKVARKEWKILTWERRIYKIEVRKDGAEFQIYYLLTNGYLMCVSNLFKTKKEARAACKIRNAQIAKETNDG